MLFRRISLIERNGFFDELTFSLFSLHRRFQYLFLRSSDIWKARICSYFIQSCIWIDTSSIINESCLRRCSSIQSIDFICLTRNNLIFIFGFICCWIWTQTKLLLGLLWCLAILKWWQPHCDLFLVTRDIVWLILSFVYRCLCISLFKPRSDIWIYERTLIWQRLFKFFD